VESSPVYFQQQNFGMEVALEEYVKVIDSSAAKKLFQ
jgi:hypothetical protein